MAASSDSELQKLRAYEALSAHPRLADLVALTREVVGAMAKERRAAVSPGARAKAEEAKLGTDASTDFGDPVSVLERGPEGDAERALACALWAHAIAETKLHGQDEEDALAADVLWLAAHTPFDATALLDRALGESADVVWDAVADRVRRIDAHKLPALGRGEALVGCAALALSDSRAARRHAASLANELGDPVFARVLASAGKHPASSARLAAAAPLVPSTSSVRAATAVSERAPADGDDEPTDRVAPSARVAAATAAATEHDGEHEDGDDEPEEREEGDTIDSGPPVRARSVPPSASRRAVGGQTHLRGELAAPPRGAVATTALALTGILLVANAVRLVARLALAYRSPAEVTLTPESVRIESRTEMLGRTLRERKVVITREALVRAGREVRYPRASFYAGLLALAIGSYVGVAALVDGVRSASPSLLLTGLLIVAVGIALDFALASLFPGARGRCRVVFVPRRGPTICIGAVDVETADDALGLLVRR